MNGDRGMIYIYAINTEENLCETKMHSLVSVLSEERQRKIWKFRCKADQKRSILGEALLKYMLWEHYGLLGKEIHFKYGKFGKPFLAGVDGIYFNLSHAGKWVLCGVGSVPVGVDVEGEVSDFMLIAESCFTKEEYEYLIGHPPENRHDIFCKIWTLKESYVKCTGRGLNISFDSCRFAFSDQEIQMYRNGVICTDYLFKSWQFDPSYRMALCVQDKDCSIWRNEINLVSINELAAWKERCGRGWRE